MTSLLKCGLQARALREQGFDQAALDAYQDALRSKKRNPDLLKEARYERGKLLLADGKTARAMKDLQRVYANDRATEMWPRSFEMEGPNDSPPAMTPNAASHSTSASLRDQSQNRLRWARSQPATPILVYKLPSLEVR